MAGCTIIGDAVVEEAATLPQQAPETSPCGAAMLQDALNQPTDISEEV